MSRKATTFACAGLIMLGACADMTTDQQMVVGGLAGATVGAVTAKVFDADPDWTIIAVLAGATAGTLVARNDSNNQCAYSNGDGTYRLAPCP